MVCERREKYRPPLQNFKQDDTDSRKYECPFKVHGYMLENNNWRLNVIYGLRNHDMCQKFIVHQIVCRLIPKEKECVTDMTLNLVQPKNILATLKCKRPENISNIKQLYNIRYQTNKTIRGIELKRNYCWNYWITTIMCLGIEHARMELPLEIYF